MWTDRWTGTTIGAALGAAASRYGDRDAFIFGERHLGFRELEQVAVGEEPRHCLPVTRTGRPLTYPFGEP